MPVVNDPSPTSGDVDELASLLRCRHVLVLSGAGISTESGIPDYRSPKSLERPRNPMRHQQFVASSDARRRYWARSLVGWPSIYEAKPNRGHYALARLEAGGAITGLITQNVDGLHGAAGSQKVLELHGSLASVRCLQCHTTEPRQELQARLHALNPRFQARRVELTPDGDAEIPQALIAGFCVPSCLHCGGVLKPDVVFFGENVPKEQVARAWHMLEQAEVLLVVGSSLTVFSGYRFVARAAKERKPVVIINNGPTRGDQDASFRVGGWLGEVLPRLASSLLDKVTN